MLASVIGDRDLNFSSTMKIMHKYLASANCGHCNNFISDADYISYEVDLNRFDGSVMALNFRLKHPLSTEICRF